MATRGLSVLRSLAASLQVAPGAHPAAHQLDPADTRRFEDEAAAAGALQAGIELLGDLQDRLHAQRTHAVLLALQGVDTSGKDGAIKHVISGVNAGGLMVHSYSTPTTDEYAHDFLWRHERDAPPRGTIAVFNRSHYEEVLMVRVHAELLDQRGLKRTPRIWQQRFAAINDWERRLSENNVRVVKVFLNLSYREQRSRLLKRIDDPRKNWKFSMDDLRERRHWRAYQSAHRDVLQRTGTRWAPWHVVPADHKWFARIAVAAIVVDALATIDPRYPTLTQAARRELARARAELAAR